MIPPENERIIRQLRALYAGYGYSQYKMSRFEEYELYVRNKDFLVSDQVITFTDRSGRLMALKPDVTLSIIKSADPEPGGVRKVFYHENVYRVDPTSRCFREIPQVGLECVGDVKAYEIAETVLLAVKSLALLSERYLLAISHMGLVSAVLRSAGVGDREQEALILIRQKNAHELKDLCARTGARWEKLEALLMDGGTEVLQALRAVLDTEEELASYEAFAGLCRVLEDCGVGGCIRVDFSVGGEVKYYCGAVFKGYVRGVAQSVLSGGQYDRLLEKMGKRGGAIGFAVYVNLLERLGGRRDTYDVDTVLLYEEGEDPAVVLAARNTLGTDVLVARELPEKIRCRRVMALRQGEAVLLEQYG